MSNNRAIKAMRTKHAGKGILYKDFKGIYGDAREGLQTIADVIEEDAVEAGFLRQQDQTSLFGNIKVYEIRITDEEHPYYECLKYYIGNPVEYITLKLGPESAKLQFSAGKFGNEGVVFNMIDGIYNFVGTLCVIDSHGFLPEDTEGCEEGKLLDLYVQQYYDWIAKH